jgi:hypothetical protein
MVWKRERDRRVTKFRKHPRSSENVQERPGASMSVHDVLKIE